jgi:general secretion pathway protein A
MYARHWGLIEAPFANALDPRAFHESAGHAEALARLTYLVERRRQFGVLTGPSGTGKSMLLRRLAGELRRQPGEVVCVDLLGRSASELLACTLAELGLTRRLDDSIRLLWRDVEDHLQSAQQARVPAVLMFDHLERAAADCPRAVERLYQLISAESSSTTLLVAVRGESPRKMPHLFAELADLRIELSPLDREETEAYIVAHLARVGAKRKIFEPAAFERIFLETRGVPRQINRLCEMALLAGMADGARSISEAMVAAAADELHVGQPRSSGLELDFGFDESALAVDA